MGRTKADSIELDPKPVDSHVARTVVVEDGAELDIFRRNTPYGTVSEHGTMFIGFSVDQHRLDRMLRRMAGAEDGIRDALTRYTRPLTGAYSSSRLSRRSARLDATLAPVQSHGGGPQQPQRNSGHAVAEAQDVASEGETKPWTKSVPSRSRPAPVAGKSCAVTVSAALASSATIRPWRR